MTSSSGRCYVQMSVVPGSGKSTRARELGTLMPAVGGLLLDTSMRLSECVALAMDYIRAADTYRVRQ